MNNSIEQTLNKIRDEVNRSELREQHKRLYADFSNSVDSYAKFAPCDATPNEFEELKNKATKLEVEFEQSHPQLASLIKDIIRKLSDMGV